MAFLSNFAARILGAPTDKELERSLFSEFCLKNQVYVNKKGTSHRLNKTISNPKFKEKVTFYIAKHGDEDTFLITNFDPDLGILEGAYIDNKSYNNWNILARDYVINEKNNAYPISFFSYVKIKSKEIKELKSVSISERKHVDRVNSDISEDQTRKFKFVCPSCGFESRVPSGKKGVVTCPDCQFKTTINQDGSTVSQVAEDTEEHATERAEKPEKIDKKFYEDSADRYAKQKEENRRNQSLDNRLEKHFENIPGPLKTSGGISIEWLRENAEYFERKKSRGRELSDYEQGLIDQYKAAQKQEYAETADADTDDRGRLKRGFEKVLEKEISQNTRRMTIVGVGGGGCEIIDLIRNMEIEDADWIALDRTADRLSHISCPDKIYIDFESPDVDEDQVELLKIICKNRDHVVFVTRLGGNYGSFMVKWVADKIQDSEDSRIHLIVTLPFQFEGKQRRENAENALSECRSKIKNILVLKNQELFSKSDEKTTFRDAMEITASEVKNYLSSL